MTELQKIENEVNMLKGLLQKETNLLKQGQLSARIKELTDILNKQRPSIKNPAAKAGATVDLKSSQIGTHESQKINKDWDSRVKK